MQLGQPARLEAPAVPRGRLAMEPLGRLQGELGELTRDGGEGGSLFFPLTSTWEWQEVAKPRHSFKHPAALCPSQALPLGEAQMPTLGRQAPVSLKAQEKGGGGAPDSPT